MANYRHTWEITEYGFGSNTEFELLMSDSYTDMIDPLTDFIDVSSPGVNSLNQSIEGETLNVFSERLRIEFKSELVNGTADNLALMNEIIQSVNNNTPFYARLNLNGNALFTGKLDRYSFSSKMIDETQVDYLHSDFDNDYEIEFEETGSNIFKEIENADILTDGTGSFLERLEGAGLIENKQGAFTDSVTSDGYTYNINLKTQKLISLGTFLTELLVELKDYINANYTITINTTTLDAGNTNIGVASPVGTFLTEMPKTVFRPTFPTQNDLGDRIRPFSQEFGSDNTTRGNTLQKLTLWNNTQVLYVNNTVEKNNIFIPARQIFDNVSDLVPTFSFSKFGYDDNQEKVYHFKTSTIFIYDMLSLLFANLSMTYRIAIEDDELILSVNNLDEVAGGNQEVYCQTISEFSEKVKEEETEEEEETGLVYTDPVNAYAYPNENYSTENERLVFDETKPLLLTINPAYRNNIAWNLNTNYFAMMDGHIEETERTSDNDRKYEGCPLSPITTMFMKVENYVATPNETAYGFDTYRPNDFWCPIGKLAYKVNSNTYKSFTRISDRLGFFKDRFKGREDGNLLKEASCDIANISGFSTSSTGSSPSALNLRAGYNLIVNGEKYFITGVERDLTNYTTKLNLIADGFFNLETPTTDDTDDINSFLPPPIDTGTPVEESTGEEAAGETIDILDVVAYSSDGLITNFENTTDYYNEVAGIATKKTVGDGTTYITVQSKGRLQNSAWSWTPDGTIYAVYNSTESKMELTQTEPTYSAGSSEVLIVIGSAISSDTININISDYIFG